MKHGGTPLHWATSREIISAMADLGCSINARNFHGHTALHKMVSSYLLLVEPYFPCGFKGIQRDRASWNATCPMFFLLGGYRPLPLKIFSRLEACTPHSSFLYFTNKRSWWIGKLMAMTRRVFRCMSLNPLHSPRLGRSSKSFERKDCCSPCQGVHGVNPDHFEKKKKKCIYTQLVCQLYACISHFVSQLTVAEHSNKNH